VRNARDIVSWRRYRGSLVHMEGAGFHAILWDSMVEFYDSIVV